MVLNFFKSLIQKIKDKLQARYQQKMIKEISENMTPVAGTVIYLERYTKGKFKYKVLVKSAANQTVMVKVKKKDKINLKQGDRVHGYYDKERTALLEVA